MCSINGFNFADKELLQEMNRLTRHRGPDGTGTFVRDGISLGHNRLSIIDLSAQASQPMFSADQRHVIVYNGELYNFQELKKQLRDHYPFQTQSDTEVILASYQKWGGACLEKFNGIFAFAIWDTGKRELFLARDQLGIKPLYYYFNQGKFIFASEIKAILAHDVPRLVNQEALNHYLRLLYVPEPFTMFQGISKFPAASYGLLKNGDFTITPYWELPPADFSPKSPEDFQSELRQKVFTAVERQLVSDKPLGLYLSGGIDSSVILAAMSRHRQNVDTYSVGFTQVEEEEKFNRDFTLAGKTAAHFQTNHHEVLVSPTAVLTSIEKVAWHLDEPLANPTCLPMLILAGLAKRHSDVVLTGDGGDELFGGYERYRWSLRADYYQKIPLFLRKLCSLSPQAGKLDVPPGIKRYLLFSAQKAPAMQRVVMAQYLDLTITESFFCQKYFAAAAEPDFTARFMRVDIKTWLKDESLQRADKMAMAAGLEARVPFLDRELVEFAARVPTQEKVSLWRTKIILKQAFAAELPAYLFRQPKRGWFSPAAKWLRDPDIYRAAQNILSAEYHPPTQSLFDWPQVGRILADHFNKKEYNLNILWALLMFQLWARKFQVDLAA